MLQKFNEYFICDEGETPTISDYIFFYGTMVFMLIVLIFTLIGLGKGVS